MFVQSDVKTHKVIKSIQHYIYQNRDKIISSDDNSNRKPTFHELRHSYAQEQYAHFNKLGFSDKQARMRVAIELGHFRYEITEIYLCV